MELLCTLLADDPTPVGLTPNRLAKKGGGMQTIIPIERIGRERENR
jgi:hypothetical protein